MNERDNPKTWCDELAGLLTQPDGLRVARLLQNAGLLDRDQETPVDAETNRTETEDTPRPISIWQPQEIKGETVFVRPEPLALGDHYATQKRLYPKRTGHSCRICFFGESAAAGYLYAPHLTPAQVLQGQLAAVAGPGSYEVIDLARTNETLHSLTATVEQSLQLSPDMLVIYAGNNWNLLETPHVSPYVPQVRARQQYAEALRTDGIQGPIDLGARELLHKVGRTLAQIDRIAHSASIPVVLVVPEVNLADWESRQPVPWLPGDGTARWYTLYERAVRWIEDSKWREALAAGHEMLELDGGTCPTAYRILARANEGLGQMQAARAACQAEIDSTSYATFCFLSAPQATTMAVQVQRRGARYHGFSCVDLPEVFAQYTGTPLPGRRMFLDYCHLTAEGIHVAMAAVTARVLALSGTAGDVTGWQALLRALPVPQVAPQVEATARFGAAIHSAHRLLSLDRKPALLEHWCERALDASPSIESAMTDLLTARCAPCPAVLTAAQARNYASPYRLTMQHGWRYDYLDVAVIEAICVALERRGRPVRDKVDEMLLAFQRIGQEGVDLAYPPRYYAEPLEQFYPELMAFDDLTQRATYRSPWPTSSFCLICDGTQDLALDLTARLPAIEGWPESRSGPVRISVNRQPIGTLRAYERWTRQTLPLARDRLKRGLNRVTLRWPAAPPVGTAALQAAVARLECGIEADIHPVFGQVFSLLVRPC